MAVSGVVWTVENDACRRRCRQMAPFQSYVRMLYHLLVSVYGQICENDTKMITGTEMVLFVFGRAKILFPNFFPE